MRVNERPSKRLFSAISSRLLLEDTHRGVICDLLRDAKSYGFFVFSSSIMKLFLFNVEFLMAWSRGDFNYCRWWWRRRWYYHIFNCTNMILNFNERLLRIFKTTFCSGYRLHIETGFHFDWNIYANDVKTAWVAREKDKFFVFSLCELKIIYEKSFRRGRKKTLPTSLHKIWIMINKHNKNIHTALFITTVTVYRILSIVSFTSSEANNRNKYAEGD